MSILHLIFGIISLCFLLCIFYSRIGATVLNNFPSGINKVLLILDFFFSFIILLHAP